MAYAKGVKEFYSECAFRVGERVRVLVGGIDKKDIASDTGMITGILVQFMHTPAMRKIRITVRMDAPFFKKSAFSEMGEFVTVDACQIERIKGV